MIAMFKPVSRTVLKRTVAAMAKAGSVTEAAKLLGVSRSTFDGRLKAAAREGLYGPPKANGVPSGRQAGMTVKDFAAQFDAATRIRAAIRDGLKRLGAGRIIKDGEFRGFCGEGAGPTWAQVSDEDEFADCRFECARKLWWASAATVRQVLDGVSGTRAIK